MNIKYRIKQINSYTFIAQAKLSIFHRWGYIYTYNYSEPLLYKIQSKAKKYPNIEECQKAIDIFKEYVKEVRKYPKYISYE